MIFKDARVTDVSCRSPDRFTSITCLMHQSWFTGARVGTGLFVCTINKIAKWHRYEITSSCINSPHKAALASKEVRSVTVTYPTLNLPAGRRPCCVFLYFYIHRSIRRSQDSQLAILDPRRWRFPSLCPFIAVHNGGRHRESRKAGLLIFGQSRNDLQFGSLRDPAFPCRETTSRSPSQISSNQAQGPSHSPFPLPEDPTLFPLDCDEGLFALAYV